MSGMCARATAIAIGFYFSFIVGSRGKMRAQFQTLVVLANLVQNGKLMQMQTHIFATHHNQTDSFHRQFHILLMCAFLQFHFLSSSLSLPFLSLSLSLRATATVLHCKCITFNVWLHFASFNSVWFSWFRFNLIWASRFIQCIYLRKCAPRCALDCMLNQTIRP